MTKTIPFMMLETEIAHHTPLTPKKCENTRAIGILAEVKTMETILGGNVLPNPLKAPCVAISMHMKSWENPSIIR